MKFSVIVPVLNGDEYLAEVLDTVLSQELDSGDQLEVLVVDSGSSDRSLEIARDRPVELIEIPKTEFGHGRTRNMAAARTTGDLICFLTQDATPATAHWLAAYKQAFAMTPTVAAAYGSHLPRPNATPLMARLLTEFFGGFSPDGGPYVQHPGDLTFLSNSNSCVLRSAWEKTPFRDINYAEDQAMGMDLHAAGWDKVFHPDAAVYHSHRYGEIEGLKRYFDEYRGLRDSIGHITSADPSAAIKTVVSSVRADMAYLRKTESDPLKRAGWSARSVVHHSGRVVFGALGARADRMPALLRKFLSLEGRSDGITKRIEPNPGQVSSPGVASVVREGVEPLTAMSPNNAARESMHIAWVIPPFGVGSGGHTTIFRVIQSLESRGHSCSIWVDDPHHIDPYPGSALRQRILDSFMHLDAPVLNGFNDWMGADVAVATGWQTVYPTLRLESCGSRAYFVQDHEPEFYPTSSESLLAQRSYRFGLPCIAASPWLADLVRERYGAQATPFFLGVDTEQYAPMPDVPRRTDTVAFYARAVTPRRAVELGVMALAEVVRRRPNTRVVLYGNPSVVSAPFAYDHLGIVDHDRLRRLYAEATVGLSLSLTNYSLIPTEMMACGLPVVELSGRASESVFGDDGSVIKLAEDDPIAIADAVCDLLEQDELRAKLAVAGLDFVREKTWEAAVDTIEAALRDVFAGRPR